MKMPVCGTFLALLAALPVAAEPMSRRTPVAANGHLATRDNHMVNEQGEPIQLRGVCTHGLQWFGSLYENGEAIEAAADEWGADVIRLSVYVYEGGYLDHPELKPKDFDAMIDNIVRACIKSGVYCIIDWHVHHPGDPAFYLDDAKAFFEKMSRRYAGIPNVLYEIANEPNATGLEGVVDGRYVEWEDIVRYADDIIPIIRKNSPKALVLVGTPSWSSFGLSSKRDWRQVVDNRLKHENVAYVFHFYAAGHSFHAKIDQIAEHLPLFATEWAAATWETDSQNDIVKTKPWLEMIDRRKISWTYWTFATGKSVFSVLDGTTTPNGPFSPTGDNVTDTGRLVYSLLNTPRDTWAQPMPQGENGDDRIRTERVERRER